MGFQLLYLARQMTYVLVVVKGDDIGGAELKLVQLRVIEPQGDSQRLVGCAARAHAKVCFNNGRDLLPISLLPGSL